MESVGRGYEELSTLTEYAPISVPLHGCEGGDKTGKCTHPAAGRAHLAAGGGRSSLRTEAQGQDTHPPRVWGDPSTSYGSGEHEGATRIKGKDSDLLLGMWIQTWGHGRRTTSRLPWAEANLRLNY